MLKLSLEKTWPVDSCQWQLKIAHFFGGRCGPSGRPPTVPMGGRGPAEGVDLVGASRIASCSCS